MKNGKIIWILIILLTGVFIYSLFLGRYPISPGQILKIIFNGSDSGVLGKEWSVFYYLRLPRVVLVTLVGAGLSVTGSAYQSIFRNPLVSPDILGVSAGAGFGVALGILLPGDSLALIYLLAFVFGIVAVLLTYGISVLGRGSKIMLLVLAGIIVSSLFNALISILKYLADPYEKLPGIVFWLMGGFSRVGWSEVLFSIPIIGSGLIVLLFSRWNLNVFSLGEEEATSLGVNVKVLKPLIIGFSTMIIAAAVATSGQVTWIGLVIPHIARFLTGANHRFMLISSALLGSSFLLLMDDLARNLTGAEIPISIITAFVGAPFFAFLLIRRRESGWG